MRELIDMVSGGARTRSGPPPDPKALRRDRKTDGEWTVLPAEGREGVPPDWPLTQATGRELELWAGLWSKPQAVQWEVLGQFTEVALYVRRLAEAEQRDSAVALTTLVRQMADGLGLTIPGLRTNRWRIAADRVAVQRVEQRPEAPETPARRKARDRFRVDKPVIDGQQAG